MLKTRLWMGTVLTVLTIGMLAGDRYLSPVFPFLLLFLFGLSLASCAEVVQLLGPSRSPQRSIAYFGVTVFVLANWLVNYLTSAPDTWVILLGIQTGFLLVVFLYEMAFFTEPGRSVERM